MIFWGNQTTHKKNNFLKNYFRTNGFSYGKFKIDHDEKPSLSITNLKLPDGLRSFNTGSSLKKWQSKRTRLKVSHINRAHRPSTSEDTPQQETSLDTSNSTSISQESSNFSTETEEQSQPTGRSLENPDYDIDPDVQKLFLSAPDEDLQNTSANILKHKRRKHRSTKKRNDSSDVESDKKHKRRTKVIKFSLSKPPSPETVQVIRVDVTSNYSVELDNSENESTAGKAGALREDKVKQVENECDGERVARREKDFILKCQKLALNDRKWMLMVINKCCYRNFFFVNIQIISQSFPNK